MDGVIDLGFQCLHPVQTSAGMDQARVKREYGDRLTIYGGLDVRTTLGRGDPDGVRAEVRRLMRDLKPGGGYLFCTSHMVQPGTPVEEVEMAYRVALEEGGY
jgi:uroporphyrinogen decarboxylase